METTIQRTSIPQPPSTPPPPSNDDTEKLQKKQARNAKQKYFEQKQREEDISYELGCCLWVLAILGLGIFGFALMGALIWNVSAVGVTGVGFYGSFLLSETHQICVDAHKRDAPADQDIIEICVTTTSLIRDIERFAFSFSQYFISIVDLTIPALMMLFNAFFNYAIVFLKFIMGTVLRNIMMPLFDLFVQLLRVLLMVLNDSMVGMRAGVVGASVTVAVGTSPNYGNVGTQSSPSGLLEFFVKFFTGFIIRIINTFSELGAGLEEMQDLFFFLVKHIAAIVKAILSIIDLLSSGSALNDMIFSMFDLQYVQADINHAICVFQHTSVIAACSAKAAYAGFMKGMAEAIKAVSVGTVKIDVPNGCNPADIPESKCQKPKKNPVDKSTSTNPDTVGAGLCSSSVCTEALIDIIDIIQIELPTCNYWTPNSTSALACRRIVSNYSFYNEVNSKSQIDTMSMELCMVLTAKITSQCTNSLPPFAFSIESTAYDICVADKSGLSPPLEPFNDRCACPYAQPLCPYDCCDQYARHIIGQVESVMGSLQCLQILSQFPQSFWCPYQGVDLNNYVPNSDRTFDAVGCNAYLKYIKPVCVAEPLWTFSSIPSPSTINLFNSYVNDTCALISNQTGVCIPYNATIDPLVYNLRFNQTMTPIDTLFDQNNANSGTYVSGFIVNKPTSATNSSEMAMLFLNKFLCQQLSKRYNNSMFIYKASYSNSVNATISKFCDSQLISAFNSYNLQVFTDGLTYSVYGGKPLPVDLPGLNPEVVVFGNNTDDTVGASSSKQNDITCPTSTGNSDAELNANQECNTDIQAESLTSLYSTTDVALTTQSQLDQTSEVSSSFSYASPLTTIDPNDPNYEVKTQEADTIETASTLENNVNYGKAKDDKPLTASYIKFTDDQKPPADGTTFDKNVLYMNMNHKGHRVPLSVGTGVPTPVLSDWVITVRRVKSNLELLHGDAVTLMNNIFGIVLDHIDDSQNPGNEEERTLRARQALTDDMNDIRVGNSRVGHENFMRRTRRLLNLHRHAPTRKLLVTTGNAALDEEINNELLKMGNARSAAYDPGIKPNQFRAFLDSEEAKHAKKIFTFMLNHISPRLTNLFFGFIEDPIGFGGDYNFGGTNRDDYYTTQNTGASPSCKNTIDDGYRCCTDDASPYECCYGLLICIPLLPDALFPDRITRENFDTLYCENFDVWYLYYWNGFRTWFTWFAYFFVHMIGPMRSWVKVVVEFIAYDNYITPVSAFDCMIWLSVYAFGIVFAFVIFISSTIASAIPLMIARYLRTKFARLYSAKTQTKMYADVASAAQQRVVVK